VCQRHSRAVKVFGLASAFFRMGQVSQAKVFSEVEVCLVFMVGSFQDSIFTALCQPSVARISSANNWLAFGLVGAGKLSIAIHDIFFPK
jgi:hypothetical protein